MRFERATGVLLMSNLVLRRDWIRWLRRASRHTGLPPDELVVQYDEIRMRKSLAKAKRWLTRNSITMYLFVRALHEFVGRERK